MRDDLFNPRTDTTKCWYRDMCNQYGKTPCTPMCIPFKHTDYLLQLSNLPVKQQQPKKLDTKHLEPYTAETLSKILENIYSFVKNGFNLFLFGDTGTGKTSWAVKLMNNYFSVVCEKNIYEPKGLYISVASFLRDAKLQMNYKNENYYELLQQIQSCDIVIWDDIFQTDPTNYESQWLYSYINDRIFAKKCNIFTSNLSPEQLEKVDSRLHSRICTSSDILKISGLDRRSDNKFTTSKLFAGGGD